MHPTPFKTVKLSSLSTSANFPITSGALQPTCGTDGNCNPVSGTSQADAFIAKINPSLSGSSSLLYSTYLGGSSVDYANAVALDSSLNVYVTGSTNSTGLRSTAGVFQPSCKLSGSTCEGEPFVAKINPNASGLSGLAYLTHLGGSGSGGSQWEQDTGNTIAVRISITGSARTDFTETNTCGSNLAAGVSCNINVIFAPVSGGALSADLSISDNAAGSPQTVALSGSGADFTIAVTPSSGVSVSQGQQATYTVTLTPVGGFKQTVNVACINAPQLTTCTLIEQRGAERQQSIDFNHERVDDGAVGSGSWRSNAAPSTLERSSHPTAVARRTWTCSDHLQYTAQASAHSGCRHNFDDDVGVLWRREQFDYDFSTGYAFRHVFAFG